MAVKNDFAGRFYEAEALRNGWTIAQLKRQIDSQFYERTALSRDKAAMLQRGKSEVAGVASEAQAASAKCMRRS